MEVLTKPNVKPGAEVINMSSDFLKGRIEYCQLLINTILEYKCPDGICRITQKELAQKMGKSASSISKTIKQFSLVDNCIETISRGEYRVNCVNILEKGPIFKSIFIMGVLAENPEIMDLPYKEQAEIYGFSVKEVQIAYGYLFSIIPKQR
ncbi:MAG TPA: hypothetical protein VIO64_08820 [Pseudobacteroides sp.]|uniref:hypothetical protein n=1 Tax=Pseudobacteroides sp. TaxID=1968840 RepID=UPI002F92E398